MTRVVSMASSVSQWHTDMSDGHVKGAGILAKDLSAKISVGNTGQPRRLHDTVESIMCIFSFYMCLTRSDIPCDDCMIIRGRNKQVVLPHKMLISELSVESGFL